MVEPPVAPVKGRITVDGAPAAGVQVAFDRVAGGEDTGGVAVATTDANGNYDLMYKGTTRGAPVGSHRVRIMRDDAEVTAPPGPPIPPEYNVETTLTAEVKAGTENSFDFDVKTK